MSSRKLIEHGLSWFYDQVTGDEDARVCKDIPEQACEDQPRNFFAYLCANFLNKISDELVSARLTLPWLFSVLGVPASFIGFLVPIREAGVLLPQLIVAAYIRAMSQRRGCLVVRCLVISNDAVFDGIYKLEYEWCFSRLVNHILSDFFIV